MAPLIFLARSIDGGVRCGYIDCINGEGVNNMTAWILTYYISFGWAGYSQSPEGGIEFDTKKDCMEQLEQVRTTAKDGDGTVMTLYCKPKREAQ